MNGYSREDEGCPKLLDLIPKEPKWFAKRSQETSSHEDQKLELSLGPPGGQWSTIQDTNKTSQREITYCDYNNSPSFNYFSNNTSCVRNQVMGSPWHEKSAAFLAVMKDSSRDRSTVDVEKKGSSHTAVCFEGNSQQKRTAPSPVVGWPPVRSFRKNLSNGNPSKTASYSSNEAYNEISGRKTTSENAPKTQFVKINMEGIPIGRKVDLKAYDSYGKLSYAVDELFRGLLAAQSDNGKDREDGAKVTGNLLDGNGEYTLVYEDNEGDRMLVGDVPWQMFVSNVKRLRVLKSSELPKLSGVTKQGKGTRMVMHN